MDFVTWDDDMPHIWKNNPNVPNHQPVTKIVHLILISLLTGAFYVVLLDGLLGVAGMMKLIVGQWIIPENSRKNTSKIIIS